MTELEHVGWDSFLAKFRKRWQQGEHVFINGQTGSGKTELLLRILELRTYSTVLVTKPRDPIFKSPFAKGYARMTKFEPTARHKRILLSAPNGDSTQAQVGSQTELFEKALNKMYHQRGWAIGVDETLWIANRLKLGNLIGDASFMGRALGISVVAATQRPAHIPVIIPQSASHAFLGKTGRKSDLKTLAELGGDPNATERAIKSLRDQHDFVYVDTQGQLPLQIVNTRA